MGFENQAKKNDLRKKIDTHPGKTGLHSWEKTTLPGAICPGAATSIVTDPFFYLFQQFD